MDALDIGSYNQPTMQRRRKMIHGRILVVTATALAALAPRGATSQAAPRKQPDLGAVQAMQGGQAPRFEVDMLWPKPMPNHWILGSAVGVAVDAKDHVFVINLVNSFTPRTETGANATPPIGECCFPSPPVIEYDPTGAVVNSWGGPGQGYDWPATPTGISLDGAGNVWIAGSGGLDQHILQFTHDGKFLKQIGKPGVAPAPPARAGGDSLAAGRGAGGVTFTVPAGGRGGGGRGRGGAPAPSLPPNSASTELFGGATQVAFDAASNEAFVADGLRNRRVAVVDLASGSIKRFFGAYGNKPDDARPPAYDPSAPAAQQFSTVKCVKLSKDGMLYVCDRANDRIQVFRKDGSFVKEVKVAPQTRGEGSVWDVAFSADPAQRWLYVADGANEKIHVLDRKSLDEVVSFGDGGRQPGEFYAVHSIAVDSKGNVYTAETYEGKRLQKFIFKGVGPVTKANMGVLWPARPEGGKKP
jgi:sugar lactone lactonase YvrE